MSNRMCSYITTAILLVSGVVNFASAPGFLSTVSAEPSGCDPITAPCCEGGAAPCCVNNAWTCACSEY